uniref:Secreted protein n=1 Tax=Arundo donax TaxID=35708 RepID=A0A0A9D546_ARUDO
MAAYRAFLSFSSIGAVAVEVEPSSPWPEQPWSSTTKNTRARTRSRRPRKRFIAERARTTTDPG